MSLERKFLLLIDEFEFDCMTEDSSSIRKIHFNHHFLTLGYCVIIIISHKSGMVFLNSSIGLIVLSKIVMISRYPVDIGETYPLKKVFLSSE